jgi:hypothetical protein
MTNHANDIRLHGATRVAATFAAVLLLAGALVAALFGWIVWALQCDEAGPDCTAGVISAVQAWVAAAGLLPALGCLVAAAAGRGRGAGRWAGLAVLTYIVWALLLVQL